MASEEGNNVNGWPLELFKDHASMCEDNGNLNSSTFQEPQLESVPLANSIDDWIP